MTMVEMLFDRSLENWDRGYEFRSRHACQERVSLSLCYPV